MTINCKGELIDLNTPRVMGILNLTPDSFYDGGSYKNEEAIISRTKQMLDEGADFIDIGGYSSRPGADDVTVEEELRRTVSVTRLLTDHFPGIRISIDTFRAEVAHANVEAGAAMVNDISSGRLDDDMLKTVGQLKVPYIMMHMRGTPQTMKQLTDYKDLLREMTYYFSERIAAARDQKINDMIIDPGFGFAKTIDQNFYLLKHLKDLHIIDRPVLAGISRKSMIHKTLETTAAEALNGTTCLNTIALMHGAHILRVHDVRPAVECVKLISRMKGR
ncbi:dihydropteroate synthase [Robertkochia aurantiaca]|uniref:dihydropteroate synthase n=1 Tax=Robertkochia aurantiaca TaxID=2873700 RepID=UPI001CCC114C|nr:dihydropteroate synthase [Robertkochia sp. 3YJGBD-33]